MAEMTLIVTFFWLSFSFLGKQDQHLDIVRQKTHQTRGCTYRIQVASSQKFHPPFFSTRTVQQGSVGRGVLYRHLLQHLGANRQRGQSLPSHGGADAAAELAQLGAFGVAGVSADTEGFHGGATARNLAPLAELSFVVNQRRFPGWWQLKDFFYFHPENWGR